jgi:hypothetical protein
MDTKQKRLQFFQSESLNDHTRDFRQNYSFEIADPRIRP